MVESPGKHRRRENGKCCAKLSWHSLTFSLLWALIVRLLHCVTMGSTSTHGNSNPIMPKMANVGQIFGQAARVVNAKQKR